MSSRICRTCGKVLNGKKFLFKGRYKADCADCRLRKYRTDWMREKRRRAKVMEARVLAHAVAKDASMRRKEARKLADNVKRVEHLLKRIHGEETRTNRNRYMQLVKKEIHTNRTEQAIQGRKGLLDRYDRALARQLDMLHQGYALSVIPHIRNMVNAEKSDELDAVPDNLLDSMD